MSAALDPYAGRYCVDCKHSHKAPRATWCQHPAVVRTLYDPVIGRVENAELCMDERALAGKCGPRARLYERREV